MELLVRREKVIGDYYYIDLFSLECMDTGFTMARYINRNKLESRYEILNFVALEYWSYGENGTVLVCRQMHFLPEIRPTTFRGYVAQAGQTVLNGVGQT